MNCNEKFNAMEATGGRVMPQHLMIRDDLCLCPAVEDYSFVEGDICLTCHGNVRE